MNHYQAHSHNARSVLASMRLLVPERRLEFSEALRIAELQAARLRELATDGEDAISENTVAALPRLRIVRRALPTSGLTYWEGTHWVIALNRDEPEARQRFTLFHEYKHIVDHGRTDRLYPGSSKHSADEQAEQAADYFAGCVLMPKRLMKRAWGQRIQTLSRLAELFEVSTRAVEVRLAQLGLTEPAQRCAPPATGRSASATWSRRRYFRISGHTGAAA